MTPPIRALLNDLLDRRYHSPRDIRDQLTKRHAAAGLDAEVDLIPSVKTIERYRDWRRRGDLSGEWATDDADADEAQVVLPVLAAVIEASHGRRRTFTLAEAKAIVRVRRVAPEVPPWLCYVAARRYIEAAEQPQAIAALDEYFAFEAWGTGRARYEKAVLLGWVTPEWSLMDASDRLEAGGYETRARSPKRMSPREAVEHAVEIMKVYDLAPKPDLQEFEQRLAAGWDTQRPEGFAEWLAKFLGITPSLTPDEATALAGELSLLVAEVRDDFEAKPSDFVDRLRAACDLWRYTNSAIDRASWLSLRSRLRLYKSGAASRAATYAHQESRPQAAGATIDVETSEAQRMAERSHLHNRARVQPTRNVSS